MKQSLVVQRFDSFWELKKNFLKSLVGAVCLTLQRTALSLIVSPLFRGRLCLKEWPEHVQLKEKKYIYNEHPGALKLSIISITSAGKLVSQYSNVGTM